jgi:cytidine deaminase
MDDLLSAARAAREAAYAPYSAYAVGAALRTADGAVYTGCNVEVANYSNSLHAEEVAVGAAVSDGQRSFERLAVTSTPQDGLTPCGMCRQTLAEFAGADFPVVCDEGDDAQPTTHRLGDLLPDAIGPADLGVER